MVAGALAHADISVIVNPANDAALNNDEIKDIFLGKRVKFPNASTAKPVDQADGRATRNEFYTLVVGKDENEIKVYWSTLIFTGNGRPPKSLADDGEVKRFVHEDVAGIGYIDAKAVDKSVKVIYTAKSAN